jgi:hypothetical protein
MPNSTCDKDETDELLFYILLAITGMLGPYVLLAAVLHPIRTLKVLAGLSLVIAVLAGVIAAFVFLGWWAIPFLGGVIGGLLVLDRVAISSRRFLPLCLRFAATTPTGIARSASCHPVSWSSMPAL